MPNIDDEFHFIRKITPQQTKQSKLIVGIGDDAALYRGSENVDQVVCMDTMVENVHFTRKTMKPFDIGYKVLASNISDIAAMGGRPLFYLVSIAISKSWNEKELLEIYEGMKTIATQFEIDLIGGDTVSISENLVITVTIIGEVPKGKKLLRSNARAGDIVFVTGTIGDSGAGLEILLQNKMISNDEEYLISRHQRPSPRIDMASIFIEHATRISLNDISDGLASELHEIAEASHVTIIIDEDKLPISHELQHYANEQALQFALYGGEDFELVGTASYEDWIKVKEVCDKQHLTITEIGKVVSGNSSVYLTSHEETVEIAKKGFNHFRS